jgi:phospho-N-acetylmuramoyl-pentapeptide-transferase
MLYFLFQWLEATYQPPGFQIFQFITVRATLASITALWISLVMGHRIIQWLQQQQIGEQVRTGEDAGGVDHSHKKGTPTMGGLILLASIGGATLLWGDLTQIYVQMALLAMAWMGLVGFADDYIKVFLKNKKGLSAQFKLIGQLSLGLVLGSVLYFHPQFLEIRTLTYLPFVKEQTFDYNLFEGYTAMDLGWLIYIPVVTFILTAVSNGVNLTDGLDGLAAGVTAFVAIGLSVLVYTSGNAVWADFLDTPFLPGSGELTIFTVAMAAACFGFLWHNGYPAAVFMGDTGSLALGASVGTTMLLIRKELLIPVLCLVFFVESLSVIAQTSYFKYTRKKTGTGKRIFKMAPIHHHFEMQGIHEAKIVTRFWIVTALTVLATLLLLRIR